MSTVDYACPFDDAGRLADVERVVQSLPRLLGPALVEVDLARDARTGFVGVFVRLAPAAATPAVRDRLVAEVERAGGAAAAVAALGVPERESLRSRFEACDQVDARVPPAALEERSARFFAAAGAPPGPEDAGGGSRRALVVDDDGLVRRMLSDALVDRGFEVVTASDAAEGLRRVTEELLALDLLVTDVCMPGQSGDELVRTIRQAGGETELTIVAVSARLEPGMEARLEAAGADAVLDKAAGPEEIARAAETALERKRAGARGG